MQANLMDTSGLPEKVQRGSLPSAFLFRRHRCIYSHMMSSFLSDSADKKHLFPLEQLPLKLATHLLSALWEDRAAPLLTKAKTTAQSCNEKVPAVAQDQLNAALQMNLRTWHTGFNTGLRELLPQDFMSMLRKFCNVQNDMWLILWRNGMKPLTVSTAMSSSNTCHCNCSHALCASPVLKKQCSITMHSTLKPRPEMQN